MQASLLFSLTQLAPSPPPPPPGPPPPPSPPPPVLDPHCIEAAWPTGLGNRHKLYQLVLGGCMSMRTCTPRFEPTSRKTCRQPSARRAPVSKEAGPARAGMASARAAVTDGHEVSHDGGHYFELL